MSRWPGEFMDGRSAAVQPVEVSFDGMYLLILHAEDRRELTRWPVAEVFCETLQERDVVHLQTRTDPDALVTLRGVETLAALRELGVSTRGLPLARGTRFSYGLACAVGIVALGAGIWYSATPASKAIARRIPMEVEREWLGGIEQRLAPSYCQSEPARTALEDLSRRLVGAGEPIPPVHILNLALPNAFALPGGTVVLTRGLTELAESPDEVAGVLAHEIEHVRQRHVMAGFVRGTLLSALWAVSVGDFSGLMVIDPATAFQIATLRFSREDEAEADRGAVTMLDRARIDRGGLARFFERLEEDGGEIPEWLSSHPSTAGRAEAAASVADPASLVVSLGPTEWAAVQQACDDAEAPEADLADLFF